MTITHKVSSFPTFPISKQLFWVPGAAIEGGFTSGGARIISPEPGGLAFLDIQPSLQVTEWEYPLSSWLMSKTNGEIFTIRLAPTPQVARGNIQSGIPWSAEDELPETPWSNQQNWSGDGIALFSAASLNGSNVMQVDLSMFGMILRQGHVIGHEKSAYVIDEIEYDDGFATITVKPPIRRDIAIGDIMLFRPFFTGQMVNPDDFRQTYDAANVGNIQMGKITFVEVILP